MIDRFGRSSWATPNLQELPGSPAHAASWAIERGEDPYKAALIKLIEMIEEKKEKQT